MSPSWHREDDAQLNEARRVQAELVTTSQALATMAQRLLELAADLNAEAAEEDRR